MQGRDTAGRVERGCKKLRTLSAATNRFEKPAAGGAGGRRKDCEERPRGKDRERDKGWSVPCTRSPSPRRTNQTNQVQGWKLHFGGWRSENFLVQLGKQALLPKGATSRTLSIASC